MAQEVGDEENAAALIFPKEFEFSETLLISEVRLLLEDRKARAEANDDEEMEFSEVFNKTLSYCQTFSKYQTKENMQAVRSMLTHQPIHKFELAQLANLVPDNAEEARALLPSLGAKLSDEELEQLLDDLKTHIQSQAYQ